MPAGGAPNDGRDGEDNGGWVTPGVTGGTMAGQPMGSGSPPGHGVGVGRAGLGVWVGRGGSVGSGTAVSVGSGSAGALGALAALALQQAMTSEREMPARPASARRWR